MVRRNLLWESKEYVKWKVAQSCPTLCDSMDYTVHGILQARILECVAVPFSRGSSQPRDGTQVSPVLQMDSLLAELPGKPKNTGVGRLSLFQRIFPTQESNRGFFTSWVTREAQKSMYLSEINIYIYIYIYIYTYTYIHTYSIWYMENEVEMVDIVWECFSLWKSLFYHSLSWQAKLSDHGCTISCPLIGSAWTPALVSGSLLVSGSQSNSRSWENDPHTKLQHGQFWPKLDANQIE